MLLVVLSLLLMCGAEVPPLLPVALFSIDLSTVGTEQDKGTLLIWDNQTVSASLHAFAARNGMAALRATGNLEKIRAVYDGLYEPTAETAGGGGHHDEHFEYLQGLYRKYGHDLQRVRAEARDFRAALLAAQAVPDDEPAQLHDLEAELTYLRVRDAAPERVLEVRAASLRAAHH